MAGVNCALRNRCATCDVPDGVKLTEVMKQCGDVDTVFHLAGVNADCTVESQDA